MAGVQSMISPLDDDVDHVRGPADATLIVEYGDYECPFSRQAYRSIERVESELPDGVRFAFRHFPLTEIHPHALAASRAAEAAALRGRFWEMHELLFHRQKALEDEDLRRYGPSSGSTSGSSTATEAARRCSTGSSGTSGAGSSQGRCVAPRRCSSTASCISAATTRTRCWSW